MVSDPLYTLVKRSHLWLYQKPAQFSVALQAIPQAILLSMDSFVIRVLAPTCCNSYFEYVKFANDDREKNTIRRTSTSLGIIFTTELSRLYNSSSNYIHVHCTFLQKCISRNTIKSYAFHTSAIENLLLCHGCIFVLELHEVQYLK